MRKIFEQANRVIIWLGPGDSRTTATMLWIEKLCTFWKSLVSDHELQRAELYNMCVRSVDQLFDSSCGIVDFTPLRGLIQVLSNPWFERVWIVQETTTPNKEMLVHCGQAVFRWDALVTATELMTHLLWRPELQDFFAGAPFIGDQRLRRFFNLEKQRQYDRPTLRLLQVLAKYRHFNAADERDNIYAVRGLARDLSETEIVPNYFLSPQAVFTQLAEHLIISKRSFEYLGFCDYSQLDPRQPSWTTNWSSHVIRHPLSKRRVHDSPQEQSPVYRAGISPTVGDNEGRQWSCSVTGGLVLNVAGFCVDTVDRTARFEVPEDRASPSLSSSEFRALQTKPAIYGLDVSDSEMYRDSSETLKMAYSRTVVADVAKLGNIRERGYNVSLEYWSRVQNHIKPPIEARYRTEWGSFMFSTVGRSLFWSRENYLGLGPVDAEPGDHICVFLGGDVLYLLRPVEGGFRFIGETYVHGLMDGEAFSLLSNGLCRVESFAIL